ncbi:NAD(P)/FAD-dependent oxidoreductase [uncultured Jatrophihabitans sp.]|uniref:NAD(P)/FAD-dependent oxidoreductase n=1 Tax=uncultured Jatrophihabitans sp. TaxID=1610747 RepID=UPI0035CA10EE
MTQSDTDLIVVGAGPVGLYAAYYAGFRQLRTTLVDSLPEAGGQIAALYPEKLIHDVAGFPAVKGRDLVSALLAQAEQFNPQWRLGRTADALEHVDGGRVRLTLTDGEQICARAIVVAGGIGTFTPRPLPAGSGLVGRGVDHFVVDVDLYAGHDVLVVGGGDSAVDWAAMLEPVARSVTLAHRRDTFRAHEASVAALRASRVAIRTPHVLHELRGSDAVTAAVLRDTGSGELVDVACTRVVAALGFTANLGPLTRWGLMIKDRHIVVDSSMHTGVPGVYAAGDITEYPGKVRLISVGFGEAALAVNNAVAASDPTAALFPGHSTATAA